MQARPQSTVLLVEDDPTDVMHFMRMARKHGVAQRVVVVGDGDAALRHLLAGAHANGVSSSIVITDLNMPGMTGHELIEDIRKDPRIAHTVIFVISTSDLRSDIARAYGNRIAGYIVKDAPGSTFADSVQMLRHYFEAVPLLA